ncbi:MAG: sialidase family protein [Roseiflexaceae bacterium]
MLSQLTTRPSQRIATLMLAALLVVALAVPTSAAPPAQTIPGGSVNWSATPQIITSATRHNFPWVTVDSNDKTHVVFITGVPNVSWDIRYINNVSGAFNDPGVLIDTIMSSPAIPSAIIIAGPGGVLHLLYTRTKTDDQLYYRQSINNGATWSARQMISTGGKSAAPNMAIDPAGNAHIVWINNQCGTNYNVFYRERLANGSLSGISKPKDDCNTYQNRPAITFANGKPQIVFQHGSSPVGELYYAHLEGSQWVSQNITNSSFNSQNPAFASDGGNNLFVAWDENVNNNNHEIFFKASFDGGATWSADNRLTNNVGISTYPYVGWSTTSHRAYIVWHDENSAVGASEEIWLREFDPASKVTSSAFQVSNNTGASTLPKVGFGPSRADVVWQDNTTSSYQIYDLSGQIIGGVGSGCTGTLVLANGADQTKSGDVPAAITATCSGGGTPATMQISIDTPLTDPSNPVPVPFNASPTIAMTDGGCEHTVYVRLFKDGSPGPAFSDTIKVDDTVDADVMVSNPNMIGLPSIYTPGSTTAVHAIGPADAYEGGASDGHPNYTRIRKFFLGITDGGDCTGLGDFFVPDSDASQATDIPIAGFAGAPALPGFGDPGEKQISVVISDTIGNQRTYGPLPLIYDPDRPVLNGGSVSGDANTKTILRTLSFSGINVNDTLYGQYESLPAGKQFWGVWIANVHLTATPNITPDSPGLNWFPLSVASPDAQFSVQWSLFTGLDYGATQGHEGNYNVFVRFLDGAGNPTQGVISTTLTLDSGYTLPHVFLPAINK